MKITDPDHVFHWSHTYYYPRGMIASEKIYLQVDVSDPKTHRGILSTLWRKTVYHGYPWMMQLYSGEGNKAQLNKQREDILESARYCDLHYPALSWIGLYRTYDGKKHIEFYSTLEELLLRHMKGRFVIEAAARYWVRIMNEEGIVSIMLLTAEATQLYHKERFNPHYSDPKKEAEFILRMLAIIPGMMWHPGYTMFKRQYSMAAHLNDGRKQKRVYESGLYDKYNEKNNFTG